MSPLSSSERGRKRREEPDRKPRMQPASGRRRAGARPSPAAPRRSSSRTSSGCRSDSPKSPCRTRCWRNLPYCSGSDPSRSNCSLDVRRREPLRSPVPPLAREDEEDDERDPGDHADQHDRPEQPLDDVRQHLPTVCAAADQRKCRLKPAKWSQPERAYGPALASGSRRPRPPRSARSPRSARIVDRGQQLEVLAEAEILERRASASGTRSRSITHRTARARRRDAGVDGEPVGDVEQGVRVRGELLALGEPERRTRVAPLAGTRRRRRPAGR